MASGDRPNAPIRLRPTAQEGQFADDAGRLWVANDTRKPGSNPPEESRCGVCGSLLGMLTYQRQAAGLVDPYGADHFLRVTSSPAAVVACSECVEIAS